MKGIITVLGLSFFIAGIFACHKVPLETPSTEKFLTQTIEVTSITIKPINGMGIYTRGGSANIIVTVLPLNADQNYSVSIISGTEFASLSNNVLTAKKDCVAVLKAITADGKLSDTCSVVITNHQVSVPLSGRIIKDTVINSTSTTIIITSPTIVGSPKPDGRRVNDKF